MLNVGRWTLMVGGMRGDESPTIARTRSGMHENGPLAALWVQVAGTRHWDVDRDGRWDAILGR